MTKTITQRLQDADIVSAQCKPFHKIGNLVGNLECEANFEFIQSFTGLDGLIQHFRHRSKTFEAGLAQAEKVKEALGG